LNLERFEPLIFIPIASITGQSSGCRVAQNVVNSLPSSPPTILKDEGSASHLIVLGQALSLIHADYIIASTVADPAVAAKLLFAATVLRTKSRSISTPMQSCSDKLWLQNAI
jgi:hypothetical protein